MGACCSSPVVAASPDDVSSRAFSADVTRHNEGAVQDMVHAFATVHTAPHAHGRQRSHRHQHQHQEPHAVHSRSSIKHLLRATSPLQQPQQQLYGLSPRSYNHLQQLLPAAPMQQLARQSQHSGDAQHGKQFALHSAAPTHQAVNQTLSERPHSTSSVTSSTGTPRSTNAAAAPAHSRSPAEALSPMQVLAVCAAVVEEDTAFQAAGITPLLLASLCLIESGACPHAKHYREHLGDNAHGLCQVLLSTAQWLATSQGFDRHGSPLTVKDLQDPTACVYFAAAYLTLLSKHGGVPRSEGFVVRAYHAGPKGVDTAAGLTYLQKYLKAKHCLTQVANAMAVTLAAAALEVQVQLPDAVVPPDVVAVAQGAGAVARLGSSVGFSPSDDGIDQPSKDQGSSGTDSAGDVGVQACSASSSSTVASSSPNSRQVTVRRAAADLVSALCGDWQAPQQASTSSQAAPPGSTGAGSLLAHMLHSRWGFAGNHQQQQGQHTWPGSSTDGCGSALSLVPVAAADLCTAWQRMVCISPLMAHAALEQAAAAAALAPLSSNQDSAASISSSKPAAAAPAGPEERPLGSTADGSSAAVKGRSSRDGRSSPASPAAPATAMQLDSMPCVIHVVGAGETLQHIAGICDIGLPELLAANPDLLDAEAVHHNDCIAVPVPVVFPRLYVIQPGDTLHSIARAHEVPLGRVHAKNPELTDPTRVQPGWVVSLPGLKGDSQVALPADWLSQVPMTGTNAAAVPQQSPWVGAVAVSAAGQQVKVQPNSMQGMQQEVGVPASGLTAQLGVHAQRSRLQSRQRSRQRATASTAGSDSIAQQQQHQEDAGDTRLPSVGSGAFLFTVGSPSNTSRGVVASDTSLAKAAAKTSQQQRPSRAVDRLKGSSGSHGDVSRNSLNPALSWTVGTEAGDVQ